MVDANTKLFAVIGNPLGHTLSPFMHNQFIEQTGFNGCYMAFPLEERLLEQGVKGLIALGVSGCNVTIPYKEAVISYTTALTPLAQLCGAVNTLIPTEQGLLGDNTDGEGLLAALWEEHGWSPKGLDIVVIGAGGAAKGICGALALAGAHKITICNRDIRKARDMAQTIESISETKCAVLSLDQLKDYQLYQAHHTLINTTSLGMAPQVELMPPVNEEAIGELNLVVDIIYNPLETRLLKLAREHGVKVSSGLGMFIHQGALAYERWTGLKPETKAIREQLISQLGKQYKKKGGQI